MRCFVHIGFLRQNRKKVRSVRWAVKQRQNKIGTERWWLYHVDHMHIFLERKREVKKVKRERFEEESDSFIMIGF